MNRKKIFVAYRFTGEDPTILSAMISQVTAALDTAGYDCVSSFAEERAFQSRSMNAGAINQEMCRRIADCDAFLAVVKDDQRSEGMLIEIGYRSALFDQGIKRIPFILAVQRSATTCLRDMADTVIEFETIKDLFHQLEALDL
ncbi:hypothetical protein HY627_00050 [Candidatus Uhrbacteria bacterium]|nr:hypothetical protein [Candidatus Uhrbacteria bacterium]